MREWLYLFIKTGGALVLKRIYEVEINLKQIRVVHVAGNKKNEPSFGTTPLHLFSSDSFAYKNMVVEDQKRSKQQNACLTNGF